ncbi:3-hydroxyacyl-CoA dehydrogenase family protein [Streptomyces sp. NPDC050388]|uniref:3-hydroxyacyl-CoA dehydrogenase family protein n=1 Tax=Streptomyces sp. NPDC050388 TaxID=3155781 RepID=UPI0034348FBB
MTSWTEQPVGVVGAGTIGVSVAHALARSGVPVVIHDVVPDARARVRSGMADLERLATLRRGKGASADVSVTADLADLARTSLVVENVVEDPAVKVEVHTALGQVLPESTVVAVNTSAVPITTLGTALGDPRQAVGVHFMNPVALIDTVEVVSTPFTGEESLRTVKSLLRHMGKRPVVVEDRAGFVINRSLMLFVNEAIATLDDGVADARKVDQLFRGCLGHRSGPLQTADLIGLDTVRDTLLVLREHHGDKFTPAPLLDRLVAEGRLGRKSGSGFYDYSRTGGSHA